MKSVNLLDQSLRLGLSCDANKRIMPYFWGCIGWISVASAIVPSLAFVEFIGGGVFFIFMSSLLVKEEGAQNESLSLARLAKRFLDLFFVSIISSLIIAFGLLLLVVPGVIAGKQLVYSGIIVALGKSGPIKALNMSKSLCKVNGYSLLASMCLLLLMLVFPAGLFLWLSTTEGFLALGGFGTILMIANNLISAWFAYVIFNHMIIIAYNEAIIQKRQ